MFRHKSNGMANNRGCAPVPILKTAAGELDMILDRERVSHDFNTRHDVY